MHAYSLLVWSRLGCRKAKGLLRSKSVYSNNSMESAKLSQRDAFGIFIRILYFPFNDIFLQGFTVL